jgi:hypothetical protein
VFGRQRVKGLLYTVVKAPERYWYVKNYKASSSFVTALRKSSLLFSLNHQNNDLLHWTKMLASYEAPTNKYFIYENQIYGAFTAFGCKRKQD